MHVALNLKPPAFLVGSYSVQKCLVDMAPYQHRIRSKLYLKKNQHRFQASQPVLPIRLHQPGCVFVTEIFGRSLFNRMPTSLSSCQRRDPHSPCCQLGATKTKQPILCQHLPLSIILCSIQDHENPCRHGM